MKYAKEELFKLVKECKNKKQFYKTGLWWHADRLNITKECLEIFDLKFKQEFLNALMSCSTITEFRQKHSKFLWHLNQNLDEYKPMFIRQRFSTPQIICKNILEQLLGVLCVYNRRKVLKGKELDIYFEDFKLAFEYDSYYWHNDIFTQKTDKEKDELCKQNKITLIRIKEQSLNQYSKVDVAIHEIKQQIITNLPIINKICKKNFSKNDVLKINTNQNELLNNSYNLHFILNAATQCKSYAEFRHKYNNCYQFICRNNLYHLLDDLKNRDHRHMTKDQYFEYILNECGTYTEFLKHKTQPFAYKRKYNKEIKQLFKKKQQT